MQTTIDKFYSRPLRKKLLLIQLLLLFVSGIQFFSIPTDNGAIPASLCYFFSIVYAPYLLCHLNRMKFPAWYISGLVLYVIGFALFRAPQYGISRNILHWLFGAYLLIAILNVGLDFEKEDWLQLLEIGFCIFAVAHFLYMLWNGKTILYLLNGYFYGTLEGSWGAILPSLTNGGRNLDCTWLALGAFFIHKKRKAVYVTYVILFSFLGCSRVGVIAIGLVVLWSLIYDPLYRLTLKNLKWYVLYGIALLMVLFGSGAAQAFLGRNLIYFSPPAAWVGHHESPGDSSLTTPTSPAESESNPGEAAAIFLSGRAAIWSKVPQMFLDEPFGYGVGNSMRVMKSKYGFQGYEGVVHNVFLQWLLDEGFLGGLWYLGLVFALVVSQLKRPDGFFADPLAAYLFVYVVLSLVQFHGGEALMLFVLGIYLSCKKGFLHLTQNRQMPPTVV